MHFVRIFEWHAFNIQLTCMFMLALCGNPLHGQNSMVGDGFGGRLWYRPYNYTVGSYSAYTVCGDSNQLYGWGSNNRRELGNGSNVSTTNPVKALGMTNVRYYSTGYNMGAIKYDSTGWVWGNPISNQPIQILNNAKFLDAGATMCSFVKSDGTVWSVGNNASATFGNDSVGGSWSTIPSKAKGISTAVRVAVSRNNLVILLSDGTVMVTGKNTMGGLGNGLPTNAVYTRANKITRLKKIVDIKACAFTMMALDSFGRVFTWGAGIFSCIGNGSNSNQDTPTLVSSLSNIVAISGCDDGFHFMALDKDHNAYVWGTNFSGGSMGTGSIGNSNTPILIANSVADIMAGETFSYYVKNDGTLWATGRSNGGSIWMNLKDSLRNGFTQIDPTIAPLNLCKLSPFAGTYFVVQTVPCVYDSILFKESKNDSFKNYVWNFGDGSATYYGSSPKHKYQMTGTYQVSLIATHIPTNRLDTIIQTLVVNDASYLPMFDSDTAICGRILFKKIPKNFDDDHFYLWQDGPATFDRMINSDGLYRLQVTNQNGCIYSDSFRVVQYATPKAYFKADTYSMCVNSRDSIHFFNLSSCLDTIVRCRWDFTEDTLSSTNSVIAYKYKKADYYPVFLSVWSNHGCKSDTIDVFDILPAPKPQFDLTVHDSCFNGNSISLKNNTVKDTIEKPRFKWYFSEGYIISNKNPNGTRSYSSPGQYYIDLIYVNTNKCTDTLRKYVGIFPHPHSDFTLNSPVCSRDSIPLFNTSTSAYSPLQTFWKFGDNLTSSLSSPKHRYSSKGNYSIKLISISPQGCKDSISKTLVVYNPPKADFSANDSIQCLINNVFKFISLSKADSGNLTAYDWNFGDNSTGNSQMPLDKTYTTAQKFKVHHSIQDIFGCRDSIDKWIEVKNGPTVDFSINDASQCRDLQNFIFDYKPKIGNDSINGFEWQINSISYPNLQRVQSNALPEGKIPVDLILKTKFGCHGLTSKFVVVNPKPKASFSINSAVQCFDTHGFNLSNTSTVNSGSIRSQFWNFGDNSNSAFSAPPPKTYSDIGSYNIQLSVVSDSGCVDTSQLNIEINPNPAIDISLVKSVCLGQLSLFRNKSAISQGYINLYTWDFGDNSTSNDTNPIHQYLKDGKYSVMLTAVSDKGCVSNRTFTNYAEVFGLPNVQFTYILAEGDQNNSLVHFYNHTIPQTKYAFWNFGPFGTSIHDSAISIIDTVTIPVSLFVTDSNGCTGNAFGTVFAAGPLLVFFPNAFSPNIDDLNEYFSPGGVIVSQNFDFRIYNRWGEQLYQTSQLNKGWDGRYKGTECPQDVYLYSLELTDLSGKTRTYRGTFTLFR